jgi:hypothetical protein
MHQNELIGGVAAEYFAAQLQDADTSSTARYLLDSLSLSLCRSDGRDSKSNPSEFNFGTRH